MSQTFEYLLNHSVMELLNEIQQRGDHMYFCHLFFLQELEDNVADPSHVSAFNTPSCPRSKYMHRTPHIQESRSVKQSVLTLSSFHPPAPPSYSSSLHQHICTPGCLRSLYLCSDRVCCWVVYDSWIKVLFSLQAHSSKDNVPIAWCFLFCIDEHKCHYNCMGLSLTAPLSL